MSLPAEWWRMFRVEFPRAMRRVWLDVPSGLPLSRRAAEEGQRYYAALLSGAGHHDAGTGQICARVAALLGVPARDVLPAASREHALATAAAALAPGIVLGMNGDPAARVFARAGHQVRTVPLRPDGSIDLGDVGEAIGADTRAVVTSTVLPDSGFRQDVAALAALCRSRGTWLVIDASPTVGLLSERLSPQAPDVLVCGLAGGAGMLYRRPEVADVAPLLATAPAGVPGAGVMALGGALDVIDECGIAAIEARVHALTDRLHTLLDAAGLPARAPRLARHRANVTIVGTHDPVALAAQLAASGIDVAPCTQGLRVSVHACTLHEDLERFVRLLDRLQRGAPLPAPPRPSAAPLVCIDLNGVLDAYAGWRGADHWDPPRPGAPGFLRQLCEAGCRVTIFTTRHYRGAWRWLLQHGMATFVDEVTDRKPAADVFVDDHAVCFRGDFDALLADVLAFKPHWRRDG